MSKFTGDDSGASMVELLMVILIGGIIGTIVTNSIIAGLRDQTRLTSHGTEMAKMRVAMERVTREIRTAEQVLTITPTSVVVQQTTDTGSRVMSYAITGSAGAQSLVVNESDLDPSGNVTGTPPAVTLLSNVTNLTTAGTPPVFQVKPKPSFSSPSGLVAPSTCVISGLGSTAYAPDCVATITVHLQEAVPSTHEVIDLTSNVTPRNAST